MQEVFTLKLDSSETQSVQIKLYGIATSKDLDSSDQENEVYLEEFSMNIKDNLTKLFDQKAHIFELKGK